MSVLGFASALELNRTEEIVDFLATCVPDADPALLEAAVRSYITGENTAVIGYRLRGHGFVGVAFFSMRYSALSGSPALTGFIEEIFMPQDRKERGDMDLLVSACKGYALHRGCRELISCCEADDYETQETFVEYGFEEMKVRLHYRTELVDENWHEKGVVPGEKTDAKKVRMKSASGRWEMVPLDRLDEWEEEQRRYRASLGPEAERAYEEERDARLREAFARRAAQRKKEDKSD